MFAVPGWNITAKPVTQEQPKSAHDRSSSRKRHHHDPHPDPGDRDARLGHKSEGKRSDRRENSGKRTVKDASRRGNRKADPRKKQTGANNEPLGVSKRVNAERGPEVNQEVSRHGHDHHNQVKRKKFEEDGDVVSPGHHDKKRNKDRPSRSRGTTVTTAPSVLPPAPPPTSALTPLQQKMRAKLISSRFRHLNEQLYTTDSTTALSLFASQPELFNEYHAGFSQQVKDSWPSNPVDQYISAIKQRGVVRQTDDTVILQLPRRKGGLCTIADLGCGDAPLARALQSRVGKLNLKLHNFDLHASNPQVTVADIARLPLQDGEVDMAIFCLSLMGTNWLSFVEEAWRILRGDGKGEVWVAEVKSRFGRKSARKGGVVENSVGKRRKPGAGQKRPREDVDSETETKLVEDERETDVVEDDTDLDPFITVFQRRGFVLREGSVDKSNKMFVSMVFVKAGVPKAGKWKGMKYNGKEYVRLGDAKPPMTSQVPAHKGRFQRDRRFDAADEVDEKEEGKVLKPCVYKLR